MYFKPFEELTFSDDFMFGKVMQDPEIFTGVLERLLHINIENVLRSYKFAAPREFHFR